MKPPSFRAKGNGINAWITEAELIDDTGAGDEDENRHYCFMP